MDSNGTACAFGWAVTHSSKISVQDQVERWGAEARKLAESGREAAALEIYRRASDALPGAPWLQHRTAELARKLRQNDVAIAYFRRAAAAFVSAGFERRAIPPLTAAWTLARAGLPSTGAVLPRVADELAELLRGHARVRSETEATQQLRELFGDARQHRTRARQPGAS